MRVALIVTTLNEASTIGPLLDAVLAQTRRPDEMIVVDGGSTDETMAAARSYEGQLPGFSLVEAPGSNISQGRNRGIATTSCSLIAVTDAGCLPDPLWLSELVTPMETDHRTELISGIVIPDAANHFQSCAGACSLAFRMRVHGAAFLPTARSMAFRRDLWARLGGFPEELDFGEDAAFISRAVRIGARLQVVPQAVVRWRPRDSYGALVRQFAHYADGLARAGLSHRYHARTLAHDVVGLACLIWSIVGRHWLPWILLMLLCMIFLARKAKHGCFSPPGWRTYYRVPLVLGAIHLGTLAGIASGNIRRLRAH